MRPKLCSICARNEKSEAEASLIEVPGNFIRSQLELFKTPFSRALLAKKLMCSNYLLINNF